MTSFISIWRCASLHSSSFFQTDLPLRLLACLRWPGTDSSSSSKQSRHLEKNIRSKICLSLPIPISSPVWQCFSEYLPELARAQATREVNLAAKKAEHIDRMMKDLAVDREANPDAFANDRWNPEEQEEGDDADDDDDSNLIDRSTCLTGFWSISCWL